MDCPQPPDPGWAHQIGKRPPMTAIIDWSTVGSIATAVAVLVAAWQVRRGTAQARPNFEDDLSRESRDLARNIPVSALLGGELGPEELESAFPRLYQYFDLTKVGGHPRGLDFFLPARPHILDLGTGRQE